MYEKDALALANEVAEDSAEYWKDSRYGERLGSGNIVIGGHSIIADNIPAGNIAKLIAMHDPATVRALCQAVEVLRVIATLQLNSDGLREQVKIRAIAVINEIDAVTK